MSQPVEPRSENRYKQTLNLPKTAFPMKADLIRNEPASLQRWTAQKLYEQIRVARAGSPQFSFHDGPPYANGSIHMGHMLNKVLKDLVVRSKTMAGMDCPYVPGWDCHGLPIEHKVMEELGGKARELSAGQIRQRCRDYANRYVKLQAEQMKRLLTLADYDNPYLTMAPDYEAAVLEVFAELLDKSLVYRDLKPVHWSVANRTALAEAELEYYDREDTSVFVLFPLTQPEKLPKALKAVHGQSVSLMIWTTTPWTLPANLAVAVGSVYDYGLYRFPFRGQEHYALVAQSLAQQVFAAAGVAQFDLLGHCLGSELEESGCTYRHPFVEREGVIVSAPYVTLEDGTGLVHTAPGHGKEDYETARRYGLEIYCPVRGDGTFDATSPQWLQGKSIWEANLLVVERLRESGHLFHAHAFTHSYPHDWRGKTPVIFRATEQWFVGVDRPFPMGELGGQDTLRHLALESTEQDIRFYPEWGRNRMRGMLESRPDWCLSRQRAWGLPIPAFFAPGLTPDAPSMFLLTAASVRAISAQIRAHGSDYWFSATPAELLAQYNPEEDPQAPAWLKGHARLSFEKLVKSQDIFDVWFESGSSWHAVIRQRFGAAWYPTDLYLEGSDQHRGWFQLSLLPAVGVTGHSPFEAVLTHGFMVDKNGEKMSKSLGNTLEVEEVLKLFGADVCRWWVCSLSTDNDIKTDASFLEMAGEEYRKVRNTLRFVLGNLSDFDPQKHSHTFTEDDATSIDAWVLDQLMEMVDQVRLAYSEYQFAKAHDLLYGFCNTTLSATYLFALKDRLYCDRADGPRRRRSQTALFRIADSLIRLLAPILPHTAEEAWQILHGASAPSVHLQLLPDPVETPVDEQWPEVIDGREIALKKIEQFRQSHEPAAAGDKKSALDPLDLGLQLLFTGGAASYFMKFKRVDFADLCGVSRVEIIRADEDGSKEGPTDIADFLTVLDLRQEARCQRSRKRDGTVKERSDGGLLSDRDAQALGLA